MKHNRLSIDLESPELKERFKNRLPYWGMQRPTVNALVKCCLEFFDRVGLMPALEAFKMGNVRLEIKDVTLGGKSSDVNTEKKE